VRLDEILDAGLSEGAAVVLGTRSTVVNFRIANSTVTTNGREESNSAGVIAIENDQVGVQSADVHLPSQVRELASQARGRALQSLTAPDAMPLLLPEEVRDGRPDALASGPESAPSDLEPILDSTLAVLERTRQDGLRCYSYAQAATAQEQLGTRTGVRLRGLRQAASLSLTLKTSDLARSVWTGATAQRLSQIDPQTMYRKARQRLTWTKRSVQLPAGHYQVILEPSATSDLVLRLLWEMHARGADEGRTVFTGPSGSRVGEAMYASSVTLESDPLAPNMAVPNFVRALGSSEYSSVFDNGLSTPATIWVDGGVQQELICPRRWAKDHGHPARPYVDNLRMRGTDTTVEQMVASTDRALLVTSLWYIRDVDPSTLLLTGLTRDGVFLVERGEVVGAVNNFRFNESPVGVLERTVEVGRTELALSREIGDEMLIEAPPIRVDGFFMSSVSDAI
jgi:predicted Zn-dependent protease